MTNLGHQGFVTAYQTAEYIAMVTEELGRTVDDNVHTSRHGVLIQRRGKGVVRHHQGTDALGCSYQSVDIEYFQGRVSRRLQTHQLAAFGDFTLDLLVIERLAQGHLNARARQEFFENLVGATVAVLGRHHTIAIGQEW